MRFRMLGPLQVGSGDHCLVLGGKKQRSTLGFLLLQANQVVPTSHLLGALWNLDDAPTSARKILQNAVWGLRSALAADRPPEAPEELLTQAPGYMLRADPDQVDLHVFQLLVREGRALLAAADPEGAADRLREALGLWRGPVLADLVEAGISWPELTIVQNMRLDVQEDYFEAELASGRAYAVLGELETMVESQPLRERCCGQLMLALYRCGRQAEALGLYTRVRAALVEELGLEPGRELQELQQAILAHDPALNSIVPQPRNPLVLTSRPPAAPAGGEDLAESGAFPRGDGSGAVIRIPAGEKAPRAGAAERRHVSVLLVRTQLGSELTALGPAGADEALGEVTTFVRERIEQHGGVVAASMGSMLLGLFEGDGADHPARAVHAAMAVRRGPDRGMTTAVRLPGLALSAAVVTGEALVVRPSTEVPGPPTVGGALVDECHSLVADVPVHQAHVCARTRELTGSVVRYEPVPGGVPAWRMCDAGHSCADDRGQGSPAAGHEAEFAVLAALLERARRRRVPHLVTVVGDSCIGRTWFQADVQHRMSAMASGDTGPLTVAASGPEMVEPPALRREILFAHCGIVRTDPVSVAQEKLAAAMARIAVVGEADRLYGRLRPLLEAADGTEESTDAWWEFLERATAMRPLVLVVNDLHHAGDATLSMIEALTGPSLPAPLLVIVGAGPELFRRRPDWGGGKRHSTTITLDLPGEPSGARPETVLLLASAGSRSEERRGRVLLLNAAEAS